MKASDFCDFFEFTLFKGGYEDEDGITYPYMATDNQGTFEPRFVESVSELSNCFDSLLVDYINDDVESNGFVFDNDDFREYYVQLLEWINESEWYKDSYLANIVECLVDPLQIEDDM